MKLLLPRFDTAHLRSISITLHHRVENSWPYQEQ